MPNGTNNELAQAVYLAQLFAARNTCKCKACRLLRQASDSMMDQMLGETPKVASLAKQRGLKLSPDELQAAITGEEGDE
jgi:hypothetical protein